MGFADFPFQSRFITVQGQRLHYVDEGQGPTLLFIHGNPTSSYLWRNVIKPLRKHYRCVALDLIGFGKSDKPDIDYRFLTHYGFVESFVEALALTDLTLVLHDWGGPLGFRLAQQQPERVSRLCFMESFPFTFDWDEFPLPVRPLFFAFRQPRLGSLLLIKQNLFVNLMLPASVIRRLPHSVKAAYLAPFKTPASRRPIHVWPNELPINDRQNETWQAIHTLEQNLPAMSQSMLLLRFRPGAVLSQTRIRWLLDQIPNLDIADCGRGLHYVQEDNPQGIAEAIHDWLKPQLSAASQPPAQTGKTTIYESDTFQGELRWQFGITPLGNALAAESEHGLIHLDLQEHKEEALAALAKRFPAATLTEAHSNRLATALNEPGASLPLHLSGSPFQRKVWRSLLEIPSGQTRSYAQLATALDSQPRAIGQAVGKNRIALRVPCHRVIKTDGGLGGFHWGIPLKQQLLDAEKHP